MQIEKLLNQITSQLKRQNKTIAVAESCTGGLVSSLLTEKPGSSAYFLLGVVAYANDAKTNILSIPAPLLKKHGAVSRETALAMAKNIRKVTHADFGIGITGIAGPTGGTKQKPVGTVFITVADKKHSLCDKCHFKGTRREIREHAARKAIAMLGLITRSSKRQHSR